MKSQQDRCYARPQPEGVVRAGAVMFCLSSRKTNENDK